jgi:cytochrome o ubiquinol oxidase subunit 2
MSTKLHLMADKTGSYNGASANMSGEGFADMRFVARSTKKADFERWVQKIKRTSPDTLASAEYAKLAQPSKGNVAAYYAKVDADLYDTVIMKYMTPKTTELPSHGYDNMDAEHTDNMEMKGSMHAH